MSVLAGEAGFYIGLEQEFFVKNHLYEYIVVPGNLPRDNAGFLAEARGKPFINPYEAVYSLKAEVHRMEDLAAKAGNFLDATAWEKLPIKLMTDSWKKYGLPPKTKHIDNLYGLNLSSEQLERQYAGIHITISRMTTCGPNRHTQMFDFVPVIKWLDKYFADRIKRAERLEGSYAIKAVLGGIGLEYRSLPTTVDLDDLMEALVKMKSEGVLKYA